MLTQEYTIILKLIFFFRQTKNEQKIKSKPIMQFKFFFNINIYMCLWYSKQITVKAMNLNKN